MSTEVVEQFDVLVKTEWLKSVSGTYSESDYKIFSNGFRKGYSAARKYEGCQHDWDNERGTTFCRNCRVVQKEVSNERK